MMRKLQAYLTGIVSILVLIGMASAQEPITTNPLSERHHFTDDVSLRITLDQEGRDQVVLDLDDASNVMFAEFRIAPGAMFPVHGHPAPVLVAVTPGELVYVYADDCIERSYTAGTAFIDPGFGSLHTAYNPSADEDAVLVGVLLGAPAEGPVTEPVEEAESARILEECGIDMPN